MYFLSSWCITWTWSHIARISCSFMEMDYVCTCVVSACVRTCSVRVPTCACIVCVCVRAHTPLCDVQTQWTIEGWPLVALVMVLWVRPAVKRFAFSVAVPPLFDHTSIHGNSCTQPTSTPTRTARTTPRSMSAPPATTTPARRSSPWWRCAWPAFSAFFDSGLKLSSLYKAKAKTWMTCLFDVTVICVGRPFASVTVVKTESKIGCGFPVSAWTLPWGSQGMFWVRAWELQQLLISTHKRSEPGPGCLREESPFHSCVVPSSALSLGPFGWIVLNCSAIQCLDVDFVAVRFLPCLRNLLHTPRSWR